MSSLRMTSEQLAVVHHPDGRHARVLAVAGSGKTTTMAERVKYLITEQHVHPKQILVLMFNRSARSLFQTRLTQVGLAPRQQPAVYTFHALAHRFIGRMMQRGTVPNATQFWFDDERIFYNVHVAITRLERANTIPAGVIDPEEAVTAISLFKASLIPPERAGYRGDALMPLVYAEYEKLRLRQTALTFDDFVPLVVGILEEESAVSRQWCGRPRHLIVDEYQDINYGQQRLLELLAGDNADVMVVGDDDQTIYGWRGAKPGYILSEFQSVFANKPHSDYRLSHTFRTGPLLAQVAFNVITHNSGRVEKALVAHNAAQEAELHVIADGAGTDSNAEIAGEIIRLVKEEAVPPTEIRVLVRAFSQLAGLEATFLGREVPYRVVGRAPFFQRKANRILLEYVQLAQVLDDPTTQVAADWLLHVSNMPSRKLPRQKLAQALRAARIQQATPRQALVALVDDPRSPLYASQQERLAELVSVLDTVREHSVEESELSAGQLLRWLVERIGYLEHFNEYFGSGWEAFDRQRAVKNFLGYAQGTGLSAKEFLQHVTKLDTARGVPEDQQIVLTTIFREKGCEFDYVFIPDCIEGYLPCLRENSSLIFDRAGLVAEPEPSRAVECERRLFYVGITRARKAVWIGTAAAPRSAGDPLPSRFLDELQLTATTQLMGALQRLAAGEGTADALLKAVRRFGGHRKITKQLMAYLPEVGDKGLSGQVARIAAARSEVPFSRRFAFTPPTISTAQRLQPTPALHRAWDSVAF